MNKLVVLLLLALAVGTFARVDERAMQVLFTKWMRDTGKVYATDVFQVKYATWKDKYRWVQEFNQRGLSFTVAMNEFSDLTSAEFNKLYNGLKLKAPLTLSNAPLELNAVGLPASVDWRTQGVVTGIKNQGQCGSCWSFSTTGSLEGAHAIHTGSLVSLSEQNLVDCSQAYGNQGCDGGLMDDAFQYIIANHGIDTEASYPYTAEDGTCQYNAANCGSTLQAYTDVQSGSEAALQTAVATVGPVSVAIDASQPSFQMYSGGVYYEPACSSTQLDHGVLAVGYSSTGGSDYWIVKNSWGTGWGLNGYIWMARNQNNNCGIATMASFPVSAGAGNC